MIFYELGKNLWFLFVKINKFKREILLLHKQGPKVIQSHGEYHSTYDPTQIL